MELEVLAVDRETQIDDRILPTRIAMAKQNVKFEVLFDNKLPFDVKGKLSVKFQTVQGKGVQTIQAQDFDVRSGDRKKLSFQTPAYSVRYLDLLQGGEIVHLENLQIRSK